MKGSGMKAQHGHRWTNEELKTLMRLWDEGVEIEEIAKGIGVSRYAVSKLVLQLRRNGIPLKRRVRGHRAERANQLWTQAEVEFLIRRRSEKATAEQIGTEMNRSFTAVQSMIARLRRESINVQMLGAGVRKLWNPEILRAQFAETETIQ